jgi:hypothetical protein
MRADTMKLIFSAIFIFISQNACMSVISKRTDDQAWKDYFSEWNRQQSSAIRVIASTNGTGTHSSTGDLRQALDALPFRNYLISCESRECYQSRLVLAFDEEFRRFKNQGVGIMDAEYAVEQKRFLENHSFEKMNALVDSFHRTLLSGIELRATYRAREMESECSPALESTETVHLEDFQTFIAGVTFLPKAYFHCLNALWTNELDALLDETNERLGISIQAPAARKWIIQHQITPIYRRTLVGIFLKRKDQEMQRWNQEWIQISASVDWKKPIEAVIRDEAPRLRKKYHFLNVEALLTAKFPSVQ